MFVGFRDCSLRMELKFRLAAVGAGSGLRDSSVLLPVPRIATGLSRSRKKSSISPLVVLVMLLFRLEGVWFKLSVVVPALADRPMLFALTELPLRPLSAYLPYPSWPVPAAGPRRTFFSGLATGGVGSVLVRRKKPNLDGLLGLGVGAGALGGGGVGRNLERDFSASR